MFRIIILLIISLNFQSWTKADDVRDFEIEGFSIGQSLLDHFSKQKIEEEKFFEAEQGNNKEVARFYIREKKGNYDWITMSFKTSDSKYTIIELSGFIFMSFDKCLKIRDEIDIEVENLFENSEKQITGTIEHFLDKESFIRILVFSTTNFLVCKLLLLK